MIEAKFSVVSKVSFDDGWRFILKVGVIAHKSGLRQPGLSHSFKDGAMFKHDNMGQGIYVDPKRDFCGIYFGLATNPDEISGIDHSPGYLRAAAKMLAGKK